MRYRIEILYNDDTFDMVCASKYCIVLDLVRALKLSSRYKDIRVYKLIGQYKKEGN